MRRADRKESEDGWADGDAYFDSHRGGVRRRHAEAETRAVGNPGGHTKMDGMMEKRLAGAAARVAPLGPRFAAAAADRAGASERHVERHDKAPGRLAFRQVQLGLQQVGAGTLAQEGVTHPLDDVADRWKVDRDFIGEAVVRHAGTIGGAPALVKTTHGC